MGRSTTFVNELHMIFDGVENLHNKKYVGNAFYARLDNDIKFKAEFISTHSYEHYDALRFRLISKDEGELDANTIKLKDIWGMKGLNNGNFPNGISPHMWVDRGNLEWYGYSPIGSDYEKITDQITDYVDVFQEEEMEQGMQGMSGM